jgi:hypothetical protein
MNRQEEGQKITRILSYAYTGLNIVFLLIILYTFISPKKSTKSLKIRLFVLFAIDTIFYILKILNYRIITDELYNELFICAVYSLEIFLYITLFRKSVNLLKTRKVYDESLSPINFASFSFLLIFPYEKLINFEPKIVISIQAVVSIIIIYIFYKSLYNPLLSIINNLNKKHVRKMTIAKNLKLILNISLFLLICKLIIKIIFTFLIEQSLQDLLKTPLDSIIYLKYFDYVSFLAIIFHFEKFQTKRKIDESEKVFKSKYELN